MKTATITLNLSKDGHHVTREGVTPAELALLTAEHAVNSGGKPVILNDAGKVVLENPGDTGTVMVEEEKEVETTDEKGVKSKTKVKQMVKKSVTPRTASQEVSRLRQRYAGNKVTALYPGASPNLPTDFDEAYKLGLGTSLPTSKMTEVKIA